MDTRPRIVVLSGSTRFMRQFREEYIKVALEGNIPISVAGNLKGRPDYDEIKPYLDAMYLKAIEVASELRVVNVGGYIGESCRNEIEHAEKLGVPVTYREPIRRSR